MKIRKISAALLAVILLAALAACGDDGSGVGADNNSFKYLENGKVVRADVDFLYKIAIGEVDAIPETDMVYVAAMQMALMREAESQNILVSWDDAQKHAQETYQERQRIAQDENNPGYADAAYMLDYAQKIMQEAPLTEAEYLDYMTVGWQISEAFRMLRDNFTAELPAEVQADTYAYSMTLNEYWADLVAKYYDELVEDELKPILDEYYAKYDA